MTEDQYRRFIARQRSLGEDYVGNQLDLLCVRWGMNPTSVWRDPRWREEQDRKFRREIRSRLYIACLVLDPKAACLVVAT